MNHLDLSQRLAAVGEFVPESARLADIGSDHAYLPVALMLKGKSNMQLQVKSFKVLMNQHVSKSKKMDWKTVSLYVLQMV